LDYFSNALLAVLRQHSAEGRGAPCCGVALISIITRLGAGNTGGTVYFFKGILLIEFEGTAVQFSVMKFDNSHPFP
jgi:hypothetical protein